MAKRKPIKRRPVKQRKPIKLMSKGKSALLFFASLAVLIGAVVLLVLMNK
jgi:hypothetical protein